MNRASFKEHRVVLEILCALMILVSIEYECVYTTDICIIKNKHKMKDKGHFCTQTLSRKDYKHKFVYGWLGPQTLS